MSDERDITALLHRWRNGEPPFTWGDSAAFGHDVSACPTLIATTYGRNLEVVYPTTGRRLHHWWRAGGGGAWSDGGVFGPEGCSGVPGFLQSDHGAPGNFEIVVSVGDRLQHVWRDGSGWHDGALFGSDIERSGPTLVQVDTGAPHGSLHCVAVIRGGRLQHFWRTAHEFAWHAGDTFGTVNAGVPVMIQAQHAMTDETGQGNFELCMAAEGQVQHWWRDNAGATFQWHHAATFGRFDGDTTARDARMQALQAGGAGTDALFEGRRARHVVHGDLHESSKGQASAAKRGNIAGSSCIVT